MTASQMRIAETIDAFYGDAGTKDGVSRSYKQAVEDLDAETIKALDGPYRYTVVTWDREDLTLRIPQNDRPRTHHAVLQLLSRHQRMYVRPIHPYLFTPPPPISFSLRPPLGHSIHSFPRASLFPWRFADPICFHR